jgi:hypothetical protein
MNVSLYFFFSRGVNSSTLGNTSPYPHLCCQYPTRCHSPINSLNKGDRRRLNNLLCERTWRDIHGVTSEKFGESSGLSQSFDGYRFDWIIHFRRGLIEPRRTVIDEFSKRLSRLTWLAKARFTLTLLWPAGYRWNVKRSSKVEISDYIQV